MSVPTISFFWISSGVFPALRRVLSLDCRADGNKANGRPTLVPGANGRRISLRPDAFKIWAPMYPPFKHHTRIDVASVSLHDVVCLCPYSSADPPQQ